MTVRLKNYIKLITAVLLIALLGLGIAPNKVLAQSNYREVGESNGLVIEAPRKTQDTGNLGPGDKRHSHLILTNTNSESITVYTRTEIVSEDTLRGAYLADGFYLTIKDGSNEVCDGTFRDADKKGNISLGTMAPGAQKALYFYADLPGRETGNEYQGAYMKVRWVFTTQTSGNGDDDDDNGGGGRRRRRDDDEEEIIVEEPDVFAPPEEDEDPITIDNGPLPQMPKTGEELPYPFYIAGVCAIVLGLSLMRNKKS